MNTRQLSYIISIAQNKSLSAASSELGVSQPALSKYLSELEEELGTELFLRHKKQLHLTTAGQIYVDAARRIISVKEQTYHMIRSCSDLPKKTITVGVTPLRGSILIARVYPAFLKRFPNMQIVLKEQYSAKLRQSIMNHTTNISLGTSIDLEDPEVFIISAFEEDLLLFVPSFHPLAHLASSDMTNLTSIDIREFQDTPFLLSGQGLTYRKISDMIFRQNNMQPTVVFESNNNLILKNMVHNGAGVCMLPRSQAEPSPNVVYFLLNPRYTTHLAMMVPKDTDLSEEERYLIALMCEAEMKNPNYVFNPTPMAKEIIDEFHLSSSSENLFY